MLGWPDVRFGHFRSAAARSALAKVPVADVVETAERVDVRARELYDRTKITNVLDHDRTRLRRAPRSDRHGTQRRGIPYAGLSRINHRRLRVLDRPVKPADDSGSSAWSSRIIRQKAGSTAASTLPFISQGSSRTIPEARKKWQSELRVRLAFTSTRLGSPLESRRLVNQ